MSIVLPVVQRVQLGHALSMASGDAIFRNFPVRWCLDIFTAAIQANLMQIYFDKAGVPRTLILWGFNRNGLKPASRFPIIDLPEQVSFHAGEGKLVLVTVLTLDKEKSFLKLLVNSERNYMGMYLRLKRQEFILRSRDIKFFKDRSATMFGRWL